MCKTQTCHLEIIWSYNLSPQILCCPAGSLVWEISLPHVCGPLSWLVIHVLIFVVSACFFSFFFHFCSYHHSAGYPVSTLLLQEEAAVSESDRNKAPWWPKATEIPSTLLCSHGWTLLLRTSSLPQAIAALLKVWNVCWLVFWFPQCVRHIHFTAHGYRDRKEIKVTKCSQWHFVAQQVDTMPLTCFARSKFAVNAKFLYVDHNLCTYRSTETCAGGARNW